MKRVLLILNYQAFTRTILHRQQILRQSEKRELVVFSAVCNHLADQIDEILCEKPQTVIYMPAMDHWLGLQQITALNHTKVGTGWRRRLKNMLQVSMSSIFSGGFLVKNCLEIC